MNQAPNILVVETSSRLGGVALACGPQLLAEEIFQADHNHAVELLPVIERLRRRIGWAPQDVNCVALSIGPGSFTGLRIAVVLARTLARFAGVRVVAVPTLEVIAQNALALDPPPPRLVVILDAKRQQVYAAQFELRAATYVPVSEPVVAAPGDYLSLLPPPLALMGEGVAYHREALLPPHCEILPESLYPPRVSEVHRLAWARMQHGEFTPPEGLTPLYLRRPEAEEVWEKKRTGK